MYGLRDEIIKKLIEIKNKYNLKMFIFGSRARGDYKYNSDIDIAILNEDITEEKEYNIMDDIDKLDSEYKIDLIFVKNIKNEEFLKSIKNEGREL